MHAAGVDVPPGVVSVTAPAGFRATCGRLARMAAPLTLYGLVQVFVTANDALLLGTAGATAITSAAAAGSLTMVAVMFFAGLGLWLAQDVHTFQAQDDWQ